MAYRDYLDRTRAVARLLSSSGPERNIPKKWLLTTSSKLDKEFAASNQYSINEVDGVLRIQVGDEVFLWPAGVSLDRGLATLSEILNPKHPHQYVFGPTQIAPGDVVLDIGACEGSFAALVSGRCRRVIAVEPSRQMCQLMCSLFEMRNQPCPLIIDCFLGSEPSKAYFLEDRSNPGASRMSFEPIQGSYEVPVRTLDEVVETLHEKPTFIKCDAEGAATMIIAGGRNFLRKFRPKLAIASYHTSTEYRDLFNALKELGYNLLGKGFFYTSGELRAQMIHAW